MSNMALKKMIATAEVVNRRGKRIGFMRDKTYYSERYVRQNPTILLNVKVDSKGIKTTEKLSTVAIDTLTERKLKDLNRKASFERDIQKSMREWRAYNHISGAVRRALHLKGMRKTGKTTEAKRFGFANYAYVVYTDVGDIRTRREVLDIVNAPREERAELLAQLCDASFIPFENSSNALWIVDEVQDCIELYKALPNLLTDLKCDILVVSNYTIDHNNESENQWGSDFAVCVPKIDLYPMSFKEFCRVYNVDDLFDKLMIGDKVRWRVHTLLNDMYNSYQKIGGFPAVVKTWMATNDYNACARDIQLITNEFMVDAHSYLSSGDDCKGCDSYYTSYEFYKDVFLALLDLRGTVDRGIGGYDTAIYNHVLQSMDENGLTLQATHVCSALRWFEQAGFIKKCNVSVFSSDAVIDTKYYFCDVGILNHLAYGYYNDEVKRRKLVAENFMFNELHHLMRTKGFVYLRDVWFREILGEFRGLVVETLDNMQYNFAIKTLSTLSNPTWYYACRQSKFSAKRYEKKRKSMPLYAIGNIFPNLK